MKRVVSSVWLLVAALYCAGVVALTAADTRSETQVSISLDSPTVAASEDEDKDPPTVPEVYFAIDASRSSQDPTFLDRVQTLHQVITTFGSVVTTSVFSDELQPLASDAQVMQMVEAKNSRWSDYLKLIQYINTNSWRNVVVVGDGQTEVVRSGMPAAYIAMAEAALAQAGVSLTRDQINNAVAQAARDALLRSDQQPPQQWVVIPSMAAPIAGHPLWERISEQHNLHLINCLEGSLLPGLETLRTQQFISSQLEFTVYQHAGNAAPVRIELPEGTVEAMVIIHQKSGALQSARIALSGGGNVVPLDTEGAARYWQISNVTSGAAGECTIAGVGQTEVIVIYRREVHHRFTAQHFDHFRDYYLGDSVTFQHDFQHVDGSAVSASLNEVLLTDMIMWQNDETMTSVSESVLPDQAQSVRWRADFPNHPYVTSSLFMVDARGVENLVFVANWQDTHVWAGPESIATLELLRTGGRQSLKQFSVTLQRLEQPDGESVTLTMQASSENQDLYRGSFTATEDFIDTYKAPGQLVIRSEKAAIIAQTEGSDTVEVVWDYRLLMWIIIIITLIIFGLWLWWFLTRPRWDQEVVWQEGPGYHLASAVPGPKTRNSSYLAEQFAHHLRLDKTRQGYQITPQSENIEWYKNGQRMTASRVPLEHGNDLEIVIDDQRHHCRFFSSNEAAEAWQHSEHAQIDLTEDFASPHIIIED